MEQQLVLQFDLSAPDDHDAVLAVAEQPADSLAVDLLDYARAGWRHAHDDAFALLWPPGLERFDVT